LLDFSSPPVRSGERQNIFVDVANESPEHIKWRILIHKTFLGWAILLAQTDQLMLKDRKH
jgi:hypothetical protein